MPKKTRVEEAPKEQEPQEPPKVEAPPPKMIKVNLKKVVVMLAPYSQSYKRLAADQFRNKKVLKLGNVALGEKVFEPGKPYELEMTKEVRALVKDRVFQVIRNSIYGRRKK